MITKSRKFITEVISELKKVSWTTRRDLLDSTKIVVISTAALTLFIFGVDTVLSKFVSLFLR
jgi:preprotein translocase subunit SecE